MRWGAASTVLAGAFACVVLPGLCSAATPPDRGDPCASAGRDTCGTTGVGFYANGRYGVRWYGDYRGAVPGEPHTFCIDLRFWYASPAYRYREQSAAGLHNKDGSQVPVESQRRLAYALWTYGRSTSPSRQAAVMLYAHRQMGDARPGELDATALGPRVTAAYTEVARTARAFHGPYRIQTRLSRRLAVGERATATVRLLSATGRALPNARFTLSARAAKGLAHSVVADGTGRATISFTPTAVGMRLRVASGPVAASTPRIFVPTSSAGATNGQRLAAPASDGVRATMVLPVRAAVETRASSEIVRPGSRIFDRIRVHGLAGPPVHVAVELFGPFSQRAKISCAGKPLWQREIVIHAAGEVPSPSVAVARPGFYAFRERLTGSAELSSMNTDCALASETVLAAPSIVAGRGDAHPETAARSAGGVTPASVRIPALGIRARVKPTAIDLRHGTLGIPDDIDVTGWWRDGATPGSAAGSILIAGHVDSAHAGAGAFFRLKNARPGDRVRVLTTAKRAYTYRVVSVRSYPKRALPVGVYSARGAPRLVLVTCGGPFDTATGHYADNIVVTAVPET